MVQNVSSYIGNQTDAVLSAKLLKELSAGLVLNQLLDLESFDDNNNSIAFRKEDKFSFVEIGEGLVIPESSLTQTTEIITAIKGAARFKLTHEAMRFRQHANFSRLDSEAIRRGAEFCEDNAIAQVASFTLNPEVGTSGADLTEAVLREAATTLELLDVPPQYVMVLSPRAFSDVRSDLLQQTGTAFTNQINLGSIGSIQMANAGFRGLLYDVPVYVSNRLNTANLGADTESFICNPFRAFKGGIDANIYTMEESDPETFSMEKAWAVYCAHAPYEQESLVRIISGAA